MSEQQAPYAFKRVYHIVDEASRLTDDDWASIDEVLSRCAPRVKAFPISERGQSAFRFYIPRYPKRDNTLRAHGTRHRRR